MSKMKHLLRKLHIGGDHPPPPHQQQQPATPSPTAAAAEEPSSSSSAADVDFNFFEEEFQVQLALAISASDPGGGGDAETAQIKAAKQISLGQSPHGPPVESLSLRYWSYNFVTYDEKVMDGFYDVYINSSNPSLQRTMPLLLDLQEIPISDNIDYEVVYVNRVTDPALCQLEEIIYAASVDHGLLERGQTLNYLIQKIADLVVNRMGGPVSNINEMLKMWNLRSYELRNSLGSIILPLGCLDVGLSRHRALLFKVLADRINLPCMLVKGSYYTGIDEGAVNMIKFDSGSEFVIDLMGSPGALIPAELSSDLLQHTELNIKNGTDHMETNKESFPVLEEGNKIIPLSAEINQIVHSSGSSSGEAFTFGAAQSKSRARDLKNANQTAKFETDFGSLLPSLCRSNEGSLNTDAQKLKVDDVSKYVISASENPQFAHKLHAVLLENGTSESIDFVLEMNPRDVTSSELTFPPDTTNEGFMGINYENYRLNKNDANVKQSENFSMPIVTDLNEGKCEAITIGGIYVEDKKGKFLNNIESENNLPSAFGAHAQLISPLLGDASSWEISWEELHIGERIGLGSYGEVYHAEWNATEVAVKKFMDQDISGDALAQFKCEVEIMLRLRHPNLVLFMGAVTRPPNLSILTEYLPRGSLFKLLHRPNNHLNEKRRLRMAIDVAKGMNYLHTSHPTIVHRDLKTPNILVDKNWVVKVCDFGLSRLKHHAFLSSKSAAGTPEWMAPEILRNELSNEKSDVYSFGVILWELATLRVPWSGMNSMQVIGAVGFQDRHLEITDEIDPTAAEIILQCWQTKAELRPSFSDLISRLRRLQHLQRSIAQIPNPQST